MKIRWWSVLRVLLVLLWLAGSAFAWWTAPRKQPYDQVQADLSAGRIVAYQWGDKWTGRGQEWLGSRTLESNGTLGPMLAWRTTDGQIRWTNTDEFEQVTVVPEPESKKYAGPGAAAIGVQLTEAPGKLAPWQRYLTWIAPVSGLLVLALLIAGPAPRRGTRWFWFWVVLFAPYGIGVIFWLFRDHPWARTASQELPGKRDYGGLGFVIGILSALATGLALVGLHALLGDEWIPTSDF